MNESVPRVSILLTVYNGEAYLGEAIESLLAQTFRDFELIAVDDGSSDGSWEVIGRYALQDNRILPLRCQPNQGVVKALNLGLRAVRGEFISRHDADDRSHPERIARQVAFLDSHPAYGLVGAVPRMIGLQGEPLENPGAYTDTRDEEIQERLLDYMCLCGPSVTFRRETLLRAGYTFTEGLDASEDYDLCLRLAEKGKMASLEGGLYEYRQHPASASTTRAAQQLFNKATALENAVNRRPDLAAAPRSFATVSRDFLHAGVVASARGDLPFARRCLANALRVDPAVLDGDQPLEGLIRSYTPRDSLEEGLSYTHSLFDDWLPRKARLQRLKQRLVSYLYMAAVFSQAEQGTVRGLRSNLLAGIRCHPAWLLNRGVLSLLWKSLPAPFSR